MASTFCVCRRCGNLISYVKKTGNIVSCCGEEMEVLVPNTVEASTEKHIPVVTVEDNLVKVSVGSAPHPMTDAHLIQFVILETDQGKAFKSLEAGGKPELTFTLGSEKPLAVYSYCNLHGLWKVEL